MLLRYIGKNDVSFANMFPSLATSRGDWRQINPGVVISESPAIGYGGITDRDFERVPDPRDWVLLATLEDLKGKCDALDEWIRRAELPWSERPHPFIYGRRIVRDCLAKFAGVAVDLGMTEVLTTLVTSEIEARAALNKLRRFVVPPVTATDYRSPTNAARKKKGRPRISSENREWRQKMIQQWEMYHESKTGSMKEFCQEQDIPLKEFRQLLDAERMARSREKLKQK